LFDNRSDERTVEKVCQLFSCHNGWKRFFRPPFEQPDFGLDLLGKLNNLRRKSVSKLNAPFCLPSVHAWFDDNLYVDDEEGKVSTCFGFGCKPG